jgi:flagellar biosynthesis/type III secretory pathway chaperone
MSEEMVSKSKVKEVLKMIEEKKSLLARLEIINKELAEFGIGEMITSTTSKPKKPLPTITDIERIKAEIGKDTKPIGEVAYKLGFHHNALKKFGETNKAFKVTKNKDKQIFIALAK